MRNLGAVITGKLIGVVGGGGLGACTLGSGAWGIVCLGSVSVGVVSLVSAVRGGYVAGEGVLV